MDYTISSKLFELLHDNKIHKVIFNDMSYYVDFEYSQYPAIKTTMTDASKIIVIIVVIVVIIKIVIIVIIPAIA